MAITLPQLKVAIAAYLGKEPLDFFYVADSESVDTLLVAINSAKKFAQQGYDFDKARTEVKADIGTTRTFTASSITETGSATVVSVKRIERAYLRTSGGANIPIELMSKEEFNKRVLRAIGRQITLTDSLSDLGFSSDIPVLAYQGDSYQLHDSSDTEGEDIELRLDVVRWMPDYSASVTSDFFLEHGWEYLQWQAMVDGNRLFKEFVPRTEGNLDEPKEKAGMALMALIAWDSGIPMAAVPQKSTPPPSK